MSIERLVILSREEKIPELDVTDRVMSRIRMPRPLPSLKPMGFMAAVSAIAASIIICFAVHSWKEWNDPMYYLYAPIEVVLPYEDGIF